jgi:hypothetical protein
MEKKRRRRGEDGGGKRSVSGLGNATIWGIILAEYAVC